MILKLFDESLFVAKPIKFQFQIFTVNKTSSTSKPKQINAKRNAPQAVVRKMELHQTAELTRILNYLSNEFRNMFYKKNLS